MTNEKNRFAAERRKWEKRFLERELEHWDYCMGDVCNALGVGRCELNAVLRRLGITAADVKMRRKAALTEVRASGKVSQSVNERTENG